MLISKHMRLYGDAYLSKSPGSLYLGPGTDNFVFLKRYIEEKSKEKKKVRSVRIYVADTIQGRSLLRHDT